MDNSDINKYIDSQLTTLGNTTETLKESNTQLSWSIYILRIAGYILLGLTLIDWIEIFTSYNLGNPLSQTQLIGAIIERVPVPLIGIALIFLGGLDNRRRFEIISLNLLSWFGLLLGLLFILFIPLIIYNTIQVNQLTVANVNIEYDQNLAKTNEFEQQVKSATPEKLQQILKTQGRTIDGKNPQEIKDKVLSQINQTKKELKTKAEAKKTQQKNTLLKKTVKWSIAALLSGVFFISIWKYTDWVRIARLEKT